MPHSKDPYVERWRLREQFEAGSMRLEEEELEPFLDYVFGDLARRPPEIRVREAAQVVCFLRSLALDGVPKQQPDDQGVPGKELQDDKRPVSAQDQKRLSDLGETIWNIVLQNAPMSPCRPAAAIGFLRRYQPTLLADHRVPEAVRTIQALELPAGAEDPSSPPNLRSGTVTSTGKGNPRLSEDLSERIYAVYFVLRRQGVRGAGPQIAEVLNRLGVERKKAKGDGWTDHMVQERVKQHKRRKSRKLLKTTAQERAAVLKSWSDSLADFYIMMFRGQRDVEKQQQGEQQEEA